MTGRVPLRARAAALLPLAALAVHELRYRLVYGSDAATQLQHQGHAYLGVVKPLAGVLCALVAAELTARLARAWRLGEASERAWSRGRLWALVASALVAAYFGQELIEGAVVAGHPAGPAGVLAGGGWLAVPLAVVVGGLLTLVLAGARSAALALASRQRPRSPRRSRRTGAPRPVALHLPLRAPLASAAAGRAPPGLAAGTA